LRAKNLKLHDEKMQKYGDENQEMNSIEKNKTENQDSRTIPLNIEEALRGYNHMNKK
jgi:hypothetical protein